MPKSNPRFGASARLPRLTRRRRRPPGGVRHGSEEGAAPGVETRAAAGTVDASRPSSRDAAEVTPAADPAEGPPDRAKRRFQTSLIHPGRGQLIAAVMLFLLGLAGVMQVRINAADDTYASARREDLILLLDGLGSESRRLEGEIAELERTRTSLRSGADSQRVAREEAQKRVSELSILAGTAPAEGPGISMRIVDPRHLVDANVLLDAVEEMRDAGAEVIEINDTVRVVASTWFGSDSRGLVVDGVVIPDPILVEVIGEPHALEEAARFRGGIVSEITGPRIGGQVLVSQVDRLVVESLHTPTPNQYAQPASPPPTRR
jgi:uncharacterized protein YlxW (UPF0749 family)